MRSVHKLASFSWKISHAERCVHSTKTINNRVPQCPIVIPHVMFREGPPKASELECSQASFSCKINHAEQCVQSTGTINNRLRYCPSVVPHVKFGEDPT